MILTLTLNTAVDRVLLVDELIPGQPVAARKEVVCVGGKGLDASVALSGLGVPTVGLSLMAGSTGKLLESIVASYGIVPETIWVEGESRTCYVIAEANYQRVSHIKVGQLVVRPDHIAQLKVRYEQCLKEARWVVLAGSVPEMVSPGIYGELTAMARQAGVPVLLDSLKQHVLHALPFPPEILKMNQDEFSLTFNLPDPSLDVLRSAARRVRTEHNLPALVITRGAEGILAITPQGEYQVHIPVQQVVNAAGAGDAASAALAWRFGEGDLWVEALRWAGAVSAAAVLTEGTGEVRREDAERIYPQVTVI
jgi:1-phosphofructokinase family hexose kinase